MSHPLADSEFPSATWGSEDIFFEFTLLDEAKYNFTFQDQRVALMKMSTAGTIFLYNDSPDIDWRRFIKYHLIVQLKTLEARYSTLDEKYPGWNDRPLNSVPGSTSVVSDKVQAVSFFDFDAPCKYRDLRQNAKKELWYKDEFKLDLTFLLRKLLIYLMAKPGYHHANELALFLYPEDDPQIHIDKTTISKYVSKINTEVLAGYPTMSIVHRGTKPYLEYQLTEEPFKTRRKKKKK